MKGGLFSLKTASGIITKNNLKNVFISLIVVVVIYFIYVYFFGTREGLVANKEYISLSNDADRGETDDATLYFFYAKWCPHCIRAKENGGPWKTFTNRHGDEVRRGNTIVSIREIDCTDDKKEGVKSLINKYNVNGYPTIVLDKHGEHYLYDTKPDADRIEEFLDKMV